MEQVEEEEEEEDEEREFVEDVDESDVSDIEVGFVSWKMIVVRGWFFGRCGCWRVEGCFVGGLF